ncbi:MAG: hypothetical protein A3H93_19205 [Rhodocyclales bacterium RIFCSPLOWO2_02_FULL_63_24]|nr:MAG: hypothetical protein A3H93_19205 [Rhodocyclales bacterium RIFCSPLOWO2_02_FULL_63_24]
MSSELEILRANMAACGQRIQKLNYSLNKNRALFPVTREGIEKLTDDQEESIDALILRYSQCVAMIQDQIFRGIAYVEQEDISDKSNRDKSLLMEKLGAIKSADDFGSAAILRNKFSHHYPEEADLRIERLNLVIDEAKFVIATFSDINEFLMRKGFATIPT